jgi:DNA polymerase II large subunit
MDAKLHVHELMGQRYALIPQSLVHGTEELSNPQEIIGIIEATLDNMYAQEKVLENALTP